MRVRAKLLGSLLWVIVWIPLSHLFTVHPHHSPAVAPLVIVTDLLPNDQRSQEQEQFLWNSQHLRWTVIPGVTFWGVWIAIVVLLPSRVELGRKPTDNSEHQD